MKNKHRNVKLDNFLNQRVRVVFTDNSWSDGVLIWADEPNLDKNIWHSGYCLLMDSCNLHFVKSDVKRITKTY